MALANKKNLHREDKVKYAPDAFLITPDDNNELAFVTRAISFGTAGALHVLMEDGSEVTIPANALAAGVMHPLGVKKVFAASTTAASIVGYL